MLRSIAFGALSLSLVAQVPEQVRVEGRVLDPGGKPIAGAVVALVPVASENRDLGVIPLGRTSATGAFALSVPPVRIGLTLTAPGYLPHFQNLEHKAGAALKPLEVRLKKGGCRIQGTVVTAKGLKPEGTRLVFAKFSQDEGDQFFAEVQQGRFDVTLAPGAYLVQAQAKGQTGGQRLEVLGDQHGLKIELQAEPTSANPEVLAWIKAKAIPLKAVEAGRGFADMQPLKALVGDARIVALGEATHGTREFFKLKHRMLEFLATEMGFTVFGIEANLPEAFAVDEYVLTGKGDPAKALAGLYFWTWNTEEVLDMIRWMRAYNEDPAHEKKLRFYGFDMQTDTVAFEQAKGWLDKALPEEASKLGGIRERMGKLPDPRRGQAPEEARTAWTALAREMDSLIGRLEARRAELAKDGEETFDRQRQNLRVLAQFSAMQADPHGGSKVRDESMAANVRWIQEREQGARMVLWAHNGHISFKPGAMGGVASMGVHLRQSLGAKYLPIGFAFREGGFQAINSDPQERGLKKFEVKPEALGTLDAALASPGRPVLALDLRALPKDGPVREWFESPQGTWSIGAMFGAANSSGYVSKEPITRAFDALLFVNRTTAAVPVGRGTKSGGGSPVRTELTKSPVNLGFENGVQGWFLPKVPGYSASSVSEQPKENAHCLRVAFEGEPRADAWYSAMQAVDPAPYRGKKIRVSGWIRTDGRKAFQAGLWMRVDRPDGMGFFDNMMNRPITGTAWTQAIIEGPVAEDAQVLNFGCLAMGMGTAWYDGIRIEILP